MDDRFTVEQLIEEIATRVVPLPDCKDCTIHPFSRGKPAPPDSIAEFWNACWRIPCAACKVRTPFTWIRDISVEVIEKFCIANSGATFAIDELKPLLKIAPKPTSTDIYSRRSGGGFEFL